MSVLRCQHTFQGISGQPEDRYVNVWHFQVDPSPGSVSVLAGAIKGFYGQVPTAYSHSLSHYLAGISGVLPATLKMYDLDHALPRTPVYQEEYAPPSHGGSSTKNLPDEIALCLSYAAAGASGEPIARRRGRVYVGPLSDNALRTGGNTSQESIPAEDLMMLMVAAAGEMQSIAQAGGFDWSVWSPTDQLGISITNWHVDNAWDIQRRRGNRPTARISASL